jgi:hypothetical protein
MRATAGQLRTRSVAAWARFWRFWGDLGVVWGECGEPWRRELRRRSLVAGELFRRFDVVRPTSGGAGSGGSGAVRSWTVRSPRLGGCRPLSIPVCVHERECTRRRKTHQGAAGRGGREVGAVQGGASAESPMPPAVPPMADSGEKSAQTPIDGGARDGVAWAAAGGGEPIRGGFRGCPGKGRARGADPWSAVATRRVRIRASCCGGSVCCAGVVGC